MINKIINSVIFTLFLISFALGQTIVESDTLAGETWTKQGSPYQVTGDLVIEDLTIEPGVKIHFKGPHKISVTGQLIAEGFYGDSIIFIPAADNFSGWEGIEFTPTSYNSSLVYCRIQGTKSVALTVDGSVPTINQNTITGNSGKGLLITNTKLNLRNNFISHNTNRGLELNNAVIQLRNSIIAHNGESGIFASLAADTVYLENVVIANNNSVGVYVANGRLQVINSIIMNNTTSQIAPGGDNTTVTFSAIGGAQPYEGEGNIRVNQIRFQDVIKYELQSDSDGIDDGNNNVIYNDWVFPPSHDGIQNDMGAYGGPLAHFMYPPVYIDPTPLDFGSVAKGNLKHMSIKLKNYRSVDININSIELALGSSSVFNIDEENAFIYQGGFVEIQASFLPLEQEIYTDTLILHTDNFGPLRYLVSGEGVVSEISLDADEKNFGSVQLGNEPQVILTVSNLGKDTLRIYQAYVETDFFRIDQAAMKIAPFSDDQITITFTPDSALFYSDTLFLINNDPDESIKKVVLTGAGTGPVVHPTVNNLDFNTVFYSSDSTINLLIQNRGNELLTIDSVKVTGFNRSAYNLNNIPTSIPPGNGSELAVIFAPDSILSSADTLLIFSNDALRPVRKIDLNGAGMGAVITITEDSLINFGYSLLESSGQKVLHIQNSGNYPLTIENVEILADTLGFAIEYRPETIQAAEEDSIILSFYPQSTDSQLTQLKIQSWLTPNMADERRFILSGQGAVSSGGLDAETLDFGPTSIFITNTKPVTITNTGLAPLKIDSIKFVEFPTDYHVNEYQFPLILPGKDDTYDIEIGYRPLAPGTGNNHVVFYYQKTGLLTDSFLVNLSGEGITASIICQTDTVDFGRQPLISETTRSVYIKNDGPGDLGLWQDSLIMIQDDRPVFTPLLGDSLILVGSENDSGEVNIAFQPDTVGQFYSKLKIISSDRVAQPEIILAGKAYDPLNGRISVNVNSIKFDSISFGLTYEEPLVISNEFGGQPLTIDSILFSDHISYGIDPDSTIFPVTIPPGETSTVKVRCRPLKGGWISASMRIFSNDPFQPEMTVTVSCFSMAPLIYAENQICFGTVDSGSVKSLPLVVENKGYALLRLLADSVIWEGEGAYSYTLTGLAKDTLIEPGRAFTAYVNFYPGNYGEYPAILKLASNDPVNKILPISINGISRDAIPAEFEYEYTQDYTQAQNADVYFKIRTNAPVSTCRLFYRKGGHAKFDSLEMTLNDALLRKWHARISSDHVTERGIEYYIKAIHGYRESYYPFSDDAVPGYLPVKITALSFPYTTKEKVYQLISLPVHTGTQTLQQLFGDELGGYDNTQYRIFDCKDGQSNTELAGLSDTLRPGKALWLITDKGVDLKINEGKSVNSVKNFALFLHAGWNLVSSPFPYAVSWPADMNDLRSYDGTSDWPVTQSLPPFSGTAVKAEKDTIIYLNSGSGSSSENIMSQLKSDDTDFRFRIMVSSEYDKDRFNYAGIHSGSVAGIDFRNQFEPPPIGNYNIIYFNSANEITGKEERFSAIYYRQQAEGYTYEFTLESNIDVEKSITIETENLPEDMDWVIISPASSVLYGKETIKTSAKNKQFRLIAGNDSYLEKETTGYRNLPQDFHLSQNYPNPFNPVTNFEFQLPAEQTTSVIIYDILGRKIRTLILNQWLEAGYHEMEWNGRNDFGQNVSSGMYFLNVISNNYNSSIKMILQR
ncbi:MAG: choice-of-anchor D domain-containing protein [Calditrichaceae bacterium]|nr:choice-of-anchor D domain-containing protein [Calditrichaceae bacterium]